MVTSVYFLTVSSESSSNMTEGPIHKAHLQGTLPKLFCACLNVMTVVAVLEFVDVTCTAWCMSIGYILGQTVQLQRFERAAHRLPSGVLSLRRWFN